jgi:hypothetical protein
LPNEAKKTGWRLELTEQKKNFTSLGGCALLSLHGSILARNSISHNYFEVLQR